MIIVVTGHRPNKLGNDYTYTGPISTYISNQFDQIINAYSPEMFLVGGALGVDTIAAITSLHRKIPITVCVPFEGQELAWPEASQKMYWKIINHPLASYTYVCEPGYAAWKMQKRNEYMVDNANMLVAVWDESPGGTANCVKYASKINRETIFINPKDCM